MSANRDPRSDRESVWSIPKKWWAIFSVIFSVEVLVAAVFIIHYEVTRGGHIDLTETIVAVTERLAIIPLLAAVSCIMLFQGVEFVMFIRDALGDIFIEPIRERHRRQGRRQGRAEGRTEGRAEGRVEGRVETHRDWDAWYRRLLEAQEKGEPFDEPPPRAPEDFQQRHEPNGRADSS